MPDTQLDRLLEFFEAEKTKKYPITDQGEHPDDRLAAWDFIEGVNRCIEIVHREQQRVSG